MKELEVLKLKRQELDNMRVIKRLDCSDKPKIWVSNDNVMYKIDTYKIIDRFADYFEILKNYPELSKCVFPDKLFYVDDKYLGYTTPYYHDYKPINFRMHKKKYTIQDKKRIIKNILEIIYNMHENDILHGDLKSSNVLHKDEDIKIIDFEKIKIKECEESVSYKMKLKEEINQLNLVLLSVLFERDMSHIMDSEYLDFIDKMEFNKEFKEYLISAMKYRENQIPSDINGYIKSITKKNIVDGKELVKSLQL